MRSVRDRRIAYHSIPSVSPIADEWQQAGLSSIAYRLAHLPVARAVALALASAVFYFC